MLTFAAPDAGKINEWEMCGRIREGIHSRHLRELLGMVWCGVVWCVLWENIGRDTPLLTGRQMFLLHAPWTTPGRRKGVEIPCGVSELFRVLCENLTKLSLMHNKLVWPQCWCSQDISRFIISWSLSKRTLINTRGKSILPGNHYRCNLTHRLLFSESKHCVWYGNTIPFSSQTTNPLSVQL